MKSSKKRRTRGHSLPVSVSLEWPYLGCADCDDHWRRLQSPPNRLPVLQMRQAEPEPDQSPPAFEGVYRGLPECFYRAVSQLNRTSGKFGTDKTYGAADEE